MWGCERRACKKEKVFTVKENSLTITCTPKCEKEITINLQEYLNYKEIKSVIETDINFTLNLGKYNEVYTEEEISNMIATSGSITNHEWYILNLMNGLITRKERKQETTIDTTDWDRLIKEIYDFPKNDVGALEETVKI